MLRAPRGATDESHMEKRRFPYEEYNKWTVTGNQDSKLIVTALKAGELDFVHVALIDVRPKERKHGYPCR